MHIYTVHHTHKHGTTISVIPKPLSNANDWLAKEGHAASSEVAKHNKGKFYFYLEVSHEVVGD